MKLNYSPFTEAEVEMLRRMQTAKARAIQRPIMSQPGQPPRGTMSTQCPPLDTSVAEAMIADPKTPAKDRAELEFALAAYHQSIRGLAAAHATTAHAAPMAATPPAPVKPSMEDGYSPEEVCEWEWTHERTTTAKGFASKQNFIAYRTRDLKGLVKIYAPGAIATHTHEDLERGRGQKLAEFRAMFAAEKNRHGGDSFKAIVALIGNRPEKVRAMSADILRAFNNNRRASDDAHAGAVLEWKKRQKDGVGSLEILSILRQAEAAGIL